MRALTVESKMHLYKGHHKGDTQRQARLQMSYHSIVQGTGNGSG